MNRQEAYGQFKLHGYGAIVGGHDGENSDLIESLVPKEFFHECNTLAEIYMLHRRDWIFFNTTPSLAALFMWFHKTDGVVAGRYLEAMPQLGKFTEALRYPVDVIVTDDKDEPIWLLVKP